MYLDVLFILLGINLETNKKSMNEIQILMMMMIFSKQFWLNIWKIIENNHKILFFFKKKIEEINSDIIVNKIISDISKYYSILIIIEGTAIWLL